MSHHFCKSLGRKYKVRRVYGDTIATFMENRPMYHNLEFSFKAGGKSAYPNKSLVLIAKCSEMHLLIGFTLRKATQAEMAAGITLRTRI